MFGWGYTLLDGLPCRIPPTVDAQRPLERAGITEDVVKGLLVYVVNSGHCRALMEVDDIEDVDRLYVRSLLLYDGVVRLWGGGYGLWLLSVVRGEHLCEEFEYEFHDP